jgi:hypothetical protein
MKLNFIRHPSFLALLGVLVLTAAIFFLYNPDAPQRVSMAALTERLLEIQTNPLKSLPYTDEIAGMQRHLGEHGGPSDFEIPPGLRNQEGIACGVIDFESHPASIILTKTSVFSPSGRDVLLLAMSRAHIKNPPPTTRISYMQKKDIALAAWSDERYTYIMAARGQASDLETLLK